MKERVYIQQIKFVNIQSLNDHIIKGIQGLNVIVAPNQTGKSVLYKVLTALGSKTEVARDEWKDYISDVNSNGMAAVMFSDNSIAVILITPKGPIYRYMPDHINQPNVYQDSDSPFPQVIEKLGLLVDTDGRVLNIINQKSIFRFMDQSYTGPDLINQVVTHDFLRNLIEENEISQSNMKNRKEMIKTEMSSAKTMMEVYKYKDTASVEELLPIIDAALDVAESVLVVDQYMQNIVPNPWSRFNFDLYLTALSAAEVVLEVKSIVPSRSNERLLNSSFDLLNVLDIVSDLKYVDKPSLSAYESSLELVEVLDNIISIQYHDLKKYESLLEVIEVAETLDAIRTLMSSAVEYRETAEVLNKEVGELEKTISELGKEVECPIYGTIIHAEEICTPINNRLTL